MCIKKGLSLLVLCFSITYLNAGDIDNLLNECGNDIGTLIRRGNVLEQSGKEHYDEAVACWWKAAALGNTSVIARLNRHYNSFYNHSNNTDIIVQFIQHAADFQSERQSIPCPLYDGAFIIVAPQTDIIHRLAIGPIIKRKSLRSTGRVDYGIEMIYRRFQLQCNSKIIKTCRYWIPDIGFVPLLSREVARKEFQFLPDDQSDGWGVYVRHPFHQQILLPFNRYHRFMYEKKMADFLQLCQDLGASTLEVTHAEQNSKKLDIELQGQVLTQVGSFGNQTEVKIRNDKQERTFVQMTFGGRFWQKPQKQIECIGFPCEPTWQALEDIRMEGALDSANAVFSYKNDYNVNVNTKGAFAAARVGLQGHFEECKNIEFKFNVRFKPKTIFKL